jgi:hypothetical protein
LPSVDRARNSDGYALVDDAASPNPGGKRSHRLQVIAEAAATERRGGLGEAAPLVIVAPAYLSVPK